MKVATPEDFESSPTLTVERVPVPEWDMIVFVRELTGSEQDAFSAKKGLGDEGVSHEERFNNYRARYVARCMCHEDARPFFQNPEGAAGRVGARQSKGLQRVFEVCLRLNGLSKEDVDRAVKDFDNTPSKSTGSDSRQSSGADPSLNGNDPSEETSSDAG